MKKIGIIALVIAVILMAGCASVLENVLVAAISGESGSSEETASSGESAPSGGGAASSGKFTPPGPVPAGHDGVYAVSYNGGGEDEKAMFPEEVTGLILERIRTSYRIYLANVYEDGEGEKFEELEYEYDKKLFSIYFGEVIATGEKVILELSFCDEGLCGFMVIGDKKTELRLALQ